jgi:sulfur relay (sulfurtransferase) DsrF/TusC family protein
VKKVVVMVTSPPGLRTSEALRCALGMTAGGHEVTVAFAGDGVLAAIRSLPPTEALTRLRAGAKLFAELESLGAGMVHDGIEPVMRPRLLSILRSADAVVGF